MLHLLLLFLVSMHAVAAEQEGDKNEWLLVETIDGKDSENKGKVISNPIQPTPKGWVGLAPSFVH